MKLVFKKNENAHIEVHQSIDGQEVNFSYVDMIKNLIGSGKMEEPEILGKFSEAEVKSIRSMVTLINKEVSMKKSDPSE